MKPRRLNVARLSLPFALAIAALLSATNAKATTFYWDADATTSTPGFGTAGGTWAQNSTTGAKWVTDSTGSVAGNALEPTANTDTFNFGSATDGLLTGSITVSGGVTMGNTNFASTAGAITLTGSTITFSAAPTITVDNTSNTIASIVAGAGTSFTKAGSGTLILSATPTYTGTTNINAGTLQLGNGGTTGVLSSSSTIVNNGSLFINHTSAQTLAAISGAGSVTVTGANMTFNNTVSNSFTGGVTFNSGTVNLVTGTYLGFGATNGSTTGVVTVQGATTFVQPAGTVTIANPFIFNTSGNVTFTNNQTVIFNGPVTLTQTLNTVKSGTINYGLTFNGNIDGNGGITWNNTNDNSPNVQTFTGQNTFIGSLAPSNGFLDISGSGYLGGGNYSAAITGSGTVLRYSSSANQTLAGVLTLEALTKETNPSTLTLSGGASNAISGLTTVSAGTLQLAKSGSANAIAGGGLSVGTGATVTYTGASTNMIADASPVTVTGTGQLNLNGVNDTIGTLALTATAGSNALVATGAGTLTLGGNVTFTAATTGTAQITGLLNLGAADRTFTVGLGTSADQDMLIGAWISGARALTKAGTGRLTLTGSNNYTLGTIVNVGTLQIGDGTVAGTMASSGPLTMGGGAFRVRGPASGGSSQTVGSLALTAATSSTITLTPGASGDTTLTITGTSVTTGAGSAVNFNYAAGTTVGGAVGNNYVVWNPTLTGGIIGGAYTVTDSGGTGFATTNGVNVVRLTDTGTDGLPVSGGSATNAYFVGSGYSTVSTSTPGSLVEALSGAVAASNVTVDTTGLASGANLALDTNLLTLGAGMTFSGANPYEITGSGAGGLKAASAGGTIYLNNNNTSTVTINAPVVNNATSILSMNGTGTTVLSGANDYTGATVLNGGTTRFSGTMAASAVTINNNAIAQLGTPTGLSSVNTVTFGANTTGSLQLLGNSVTIGALNNNATLGTPVITNNNGGLGVANATLTINSGSTSSFGGVIQDGTGGGTLALAKSGAGVLTLSGINTFSGGLSINGGTLSASNNNQLGDTSGGIILGGGQLLLGGNNLSTTRSVTVNGTGSSMRVAKNNNITTSGALLGSGAITFVDNGGAGSLSLYRFTSSSNTFTGAMSLAAVDVRVSSLGETAGNNIIFTGAGTFSLHDTGVTAGLSFTNGNRAIELSNSSGTIQNNNTTHAITIGSNLVATGAGAKVLFLGAVAGPTNVFSGNITNGTGGGTVGVTISNNAGTWALSGTNTYSGATSLGGGGGGTLIFRNAGQSVSPSTAIDIPINNNQTNTIRLLSDTGGSTGTLTLGNTLKAGAGGSSGTATMAVFVGNNGAANNGNGAGGVTGSTIALGTLDLRSSAEGGIADGRMNQRVSVTGANSYKLQFGDVIMPGRGTGGSNGGFFIPTTAPMIISGTVKQNNGRTTADNVSLQTLVLDGTATGNVISGAIKNATDFDNASNANALATSLTKQSTSTWTLSGANTYTGATAISAGTLAIGSTGSLGNTAISVIGTGILAVNAGSGSVNLGTTVAGTAGASLNLGTRIFTMVDGTAGGTTNLQQNASFVASGLTLAGSTLNFELSGATVDTLAVTKGATVSGTNIVNIPILAAPTAGAYDLITSAATTGLAGTYVFGGSGSNTQTVSFGTNSYLLTLSSTAGAVTVTAGAATAITSGGLTWTGRTNGSTVDNTNWNNGVSNNWAANTTASTFNNGTAVTFGNTNAVGGTAPTGVVVIEAGGVTPTSTTFDNTTTYTLSGGGIGGAGTLTKNNTGIVTLSGTNTYAGATTINAGTLQFATQGSLYNNTPANWTAANIVVAGTLALNVGGTNQFTTGNVTTLLTNLGGANGTSTTGFSAGSRIAFDTTNAAGNTFTVADIIADSTGSGGGAIGVTKLGNNTLVLSNAGNSYTGGTLIRQGIIALGDDAALGAGTLTMGVTGDTSFTVAIQSTDGTTRNIANALGTIAGTTPVLTFGATTGGTGALNFNNTTAVSLGATVRNFTVNNTTTFANAFTSTSGGINKLGAGTLALTSGSSSYTGVTSITAGRLEVSVMNTGGNNSSIGASTNAAANLVFLGGSAFGTLRYVGSANIVTDRSFTTSNGSGGGANIESSGLGTLSFSSATPANLSYGTGNEIRSIVLGGTNTGDNTFSKVIANNTQVTNLTKNGVGKWIINNANTYTGKTTVNAGTLQFAKMTSLNNNVDTNWTAAKINVKSAATLALNVDSAGTNGFTDVKLNTLLGNISVANTAAEGLQAGAILGFDTSTDNDGTFTQGNAFADSTGSGAFHGAISLTKLGAGTLVLDKSNTYTGTTTISAGSLALGANDAVADTSAVSLGAATLDAATFTDTVGALDVTSTTAVINLGSGGTLAFADSSAVSWTDVVGNLNITGTFVSGASIRFGSTSGGLTPAQLAVISVNGSGAGTYALDASGYLVSGGPDTTPPTLTSITDNVSGGPINIGATVTYTVTFNEDIDSASVTAADFNNNGTAGITVGAISETSAGVFTVAVTVNSPGSLKLRIPTGAVIEDVALNDLVVPVEDDTTITVRNAYQTWALTNAISSAPGQDKDGDGVNNAIEFVLGGTVAGNDLAKLPTLSTTATDMIFSFQRARSSIDGVTGLTIEVGTTLSGWPTSYTVGTNTGNSNAGVVVAENTPSGFDTITLTVPKGADPKKFARLKANVTE